MKKMSGEEARGWEGTEWGRDMRRREGEEAWASALTDRQPGIED